MSGSRSLDFPILDHCHHYVTVSSEDRWSWIHQVGPKGENVVTSISPTLSMIHPHVTFLHQKRAYTRSGTSCSKCVHQILLFHAHACMHFVFLVLTKCIWIENTRDHEQATIGFGVRIWSRKHLNECTPYSGVRQWCNRNQWSSIKLYKLLMYDKFPARTF